MKCEIIRNHALIAGPMDWDASRIRDIVMRQGGDYRLIPNGFYKAIHVGSISVLPVRHVKPNIMITQAYGQPERSVNAGEVVYTHPVIERDVAEVLEEQRTLKLREINADYQSELNAILRDYPEAETSYH